jgi:nucleoside-diphosphate kinase
MIEQSLVLMKPDAVKRGIVGEILHRFERAGLKIVALKIVQIDEVLGAKHYNHDDEWKLKVAARSIEECTSSGLNVLDCFGTEDPIKIGELTDKRNAEYLASGPVIALVLEGPNAVGKTRSMIGSTFPNTAVPGTIRADYGLDSSFSATKRKRTTFNMLHASGNIEEAKEEIKLWFNPSEILSYKRLHDDLYNY